MGICLYRRHINYELDILMTCIVGIADDGQVYMGAERAASDGGSIVSMLNPKVERRNGWIYAYAGTIGIGQLMSFVSLPPECDDPYVYIRLSIVEDMKKAMEAFSHTPEEHDTTWLIGKNGRLFELSAGDWGLVEIDHAAIGSGSQYALGSLYTSDNHPIDRIQTAIDAAIEYSPECRGPVDILFI